MTASIKEREDKLCDREDYIEDQEIKLENKEEQLNKLKETLEAKENEMSPRKTGRKDEDGIVFEKDALMDKEQIGRASPRTAGARSGYRGDGF
jgi:hypothetical protein